MKKHVLNAFNANLHYAKRLVKDIPDEKFAEQPTGIANHPAFVIGHLANTADFLGTFFGNKPAGPAEWGKLFGMQSKPVGDRKAYPSKEVLVDAFEKAHARLAKAIDGASEEALNKPSAEDFVKLGFPTVGDLVIFLMLGHEGVHLGQLSTWRRVMGFPPLF
jgi:hypothetical protein